MLIRLSYPTICVLLASLLLVGCGGNSAPTSEAPTTITSGLAGEATLATREAQLEATAAALATREANTTSGASTTTSSTNDLQQAIIGKWKANLGEVSGLGQVIENIE